MTELTHKQTIDDLYKVLAPKDRRPKFGDYCSIEQKRHGAENEHYCCKIIGELESNAYVTVPVQSPATEEHQKGMAKVVRCITCGVEEKIAHKYRIEDIKLSRYEPTLNDVLLALGEDWAASSSGIYKGEDCFDSIDGYDLAKSFDAQSELTHRKLHNLITK